MTHTSVDYSAASQHCFTIKIDDEWSMLGLRRLNGIKL